MKRERMKHMSRRCSVCNEGYVKKVGRKFLLYESSSGRKFYGRPYECPVCGSEGDYIRPFRKKIREEYEKKKLAEIYVQNKEYWDRRKEEDGFDFVKENNLDPNDVIEELLKR